MQNLQIKMKIFANPFESNDQWSIVNYAPQLGIEEKFGFLFNPDEVNDLIDARSFLEVEFAYVPEVEPKDFVDIFVIKEILTRYFETYA